MSREYASRHGLWFCQRCWKSHFEKLLNPLFNIGSGSHFASGFRKTFSFYLLTNRRLNNNTFSLPMCLCRFRGVELYGSAASRTSVGKPWFFRLKLE